MRRFPVRRPFLLGLLLLSLPALLLSACRPSNVTEAEARGDVTWLSSNGSAEAVAALGRMADRKPSAVAALEKRAPADVNVFIAAWSATQRGASWGPALLRKGLADPTGAEHAASAMTRKDPHLAAFVADLDAALTHLGPSSRNVAVASALASVGPPAHAAVQQRLSDGATRGLMCQGISAPESSDDARGLLLAVPVAYRDAAGCVDAVVRLAAKDDGVLEWLTTSGEPGLLDAAGRGDVVSCERLRVLWSRAITQRPVTDHAALAVPLSRAIKRCPALMDEVLAETLRTRPNAYSLAVGGIDPTGAETPDLKKTCAELHRVARGPVGGRIKDRAAATLAGGCRAR